MAHFSKEHGLLLACRIIQSLMFGRTA